MPSKRLRRLLRLGSFVVALAMLALVTPVTFPGAFLGQSNDLDVQPSTSAEGPCTAGSGDCVQVLSKKWGDSEIAGVRVATLSFWCYVAAAGLCGLFLFRIPTRAESLIYFFATLLPTPFLVREAYLGLGQGLDLSESRLGLLVVGSFVLLSVSTSVSRQSGRESLSFWWPEIAAGLGIVLVVLAVRIVSRSETATDPEGFLRWYRQQPRQLLAGASSEAPVEIVAFVDYQCPPCRKADQSLQPIVSEYAAKYPGKVRIHFKDYPLERECNPAVLADVHPLACDAAVAVKLAAALGRENEMRELLFSRQAELNSGLIERAEREFMGRSPMPEELEKTKRAVQTEAGLGEELGVTGTPTIFLNGVKIIGAIPGPALRKVIEFELSN